jgi:ribosome-associated protein
MTQRRHDDWSTGHAGDDRTKFSSRRNQKNQKKTTDPSPVRRSGLFLAFCPLGKRSLDRILTSPEVGTMNDRSIVLRGDHITLAQALKVAGLADTGGMAKSLVREGEFLVNGEPESRPGRKLRSGDRFGNAQSGEWNVVAEA